MQGRSGECIRCETLAKTVDNGREIQCTTICKLEELAVAALKT